MVEKELDIKIQRHGGKVSASGMSSEPAAKNMKVIGKLPKSLGISNCTLYLDPSAFPLHADTQAN
eukprot:7121211-Lingulodinium_polyedra.AAC.1